MTNTQFDLSAELKTQLYTFIEKVSVERRAEAMRIVEDIERFTRMAILTGDWEAARQDIGFCYSCLASLASITASEAERAVKDALILTLTRAVQIGLTAAVAI